jgi:hypothetical protein
MPAILADTAATIETTAYVDGTATDPTVATLGVTREDGTVLVAPLTAATIVGSSSGKVRYSFTPAQMADLDILTVTWTLTLSAVAGTILTSQYEVVGDLLFTEAQARDFGNDTPGTAANAPLYDSTKYPDAVLLEKRDEIADELTEALGYAPFPRYYREVVDGSYTETLPLRYGHLRSIRAVSAWDGSVTDTFDATELADIRLYDSWVRRDTLGSFIGGYRNITVAYEHGLDLVPSWCRRAALQILIARLVPTNVSPYATLQTDSTGTRNLVVPTAGGFGIPEVDAIIERRAERRVVIA